MTGLQKISITLVLKATVQDRWHRAGDDPAHGSAAGERVTLASLFQKGLVIRRPWRGVDGEPNASYEYRASDDLMKEAKDSGLLDMILG